MGMIHQEKWDRLSGLCGAVFFVMVLSGTWLCGTVKAGEGIPEYQGFYQDLDGELYYYDRYGEPVVLSFVTITDRDGTYSYYFLEDGRAAKGLTEVTEDAWYFFDDNHIMLVSGIKILGSRTWYFGEDGKADWVLERFE